MIFSGKKGQSSSPIQWIERDTLLTYAESKPGRYEVRNLFGCMIQLNKYNNNKNIVYIILLNKYSNNKNIIQYEMQQVFIKRQVGHCPSYSVSQQIWWSWGVAIWLNMLSLLQYSMLFSWVEIFVKSLIRPPELILVVLKFVAIWTTFEHVRSM